MINIKNNETLLRDMSMIQIYLYERQIIYLQSERISLSEENEVNWSSINDTFTPIMNIFLTHLIVHVIPVAHVVACAGAGLNVPSHVELDLFAAHTSARCHHRVPHAIAAGTIHPRVTLIQVTPTGVVVSKSASAPGIRGVSHPGLRTLVVSQSRLGPMECRGYILKGKENTNHCAPLVRLQG